MKKTKNSIATLFVLIFISTMGSLLSCSKSDEELAPSNLGSKPEDRIQSIDIIPSANAVPPGITANYYVRNLTELKAALYKATPGQLVYIDDYVSIDLGKSVLQLKEGVTLMSGRTKKDITGKALPGALLYTSSPGYYNYIESVLPVIDVRGKNARIFGIRLRGADQERKTERMRYLNSIGRYYDEPISRGIVSRYSGTEIKNCEIYGWTHSAIILYSGATGAIMSGNYIHHNQREGLGYGITVTRNSNAKITSNTFDWNRHSVSSSGEIGADYEFAYNTIGVNANSHAIDVHGFRNTNGVVTSGTYINIHHNYIKLEQELAFYIDGNPVNKVIFSYNYLAHPTFASATYINPLCKNYSFVGNIYNYY